MARTRALHAAVRSGVRMSAETANLLRNLRRGRGACSAGQEVACIYLDAGLGGGGTWGRWVPTSTSGAEAAGVHRVGVEVFSFCPNVFTFRADVFGLDWRRVRFGVTTQGGPSGHYRARGRSTEVLRIECRRCFPEFTLTKTDEDKDRDCALELLKELFGRPGWIREPGASANRVSAGLTLSSEPIGSIVISGRLVAARGGVNA